MINKIFYLPIIFMTMFAFSSNQNLFGQTPPVQAGPTDLIKLQSYLIAARRAQDFNDYRNAFNYYKRIFETDWQYENILGDYLDVAIKSGAVKEAETGLLKIYTPYKEMKIRANHDPACQIVTALSVFYFMTNREQVGEEFLNIINNSDLPLANKIEVSAGVYTKSNRFDSAISVIVDGRKKLKKVNVFCWELYLLYSKKNEYLAAGLELIKHLANLNETPVISDKPEYDLTKVEAELTKIAETASNEEMMKIITNLDEQSIKIPYFYKLLSSIYFYQKNYDKAFYFFKKAPVVTNNGSSEYITFARELVSENEFEFAIAYYAIFFAKSENIVTNQQDYFNYLRLMIEIGKNQEALTILESPSLASLVNPVLLDLFKADLFFYELKQPTVSAKIIDKYLLGNDLAGLAAKKISRDLSIWQKNYKQAEQINNLLKDSPYIQNNPASFQEANFTEMILFLLNKNSADFRRGVLPKIQQRRGADQDNDLLKIAANLAQIQDNLDANRIYNHFLAYKIHRQPDKILDSLKSVSPENIQPLFFQRLLFDYVKDNNPKEAAVFINKFITAQSKSVELPSMIYDLATLLLKKPEYSIESENNLLYLLKNYPKSLYEEPARKLLRKIKSRRVG